MVVILKIEGPRFPLVKTQQTEGKVSLSLQTRAENGSQGVLRRRTGLYAVAFNISGLRPAGLRPAAPLHSFGQDDEMT